MGSQGPRTYLFAGNPKANPARVATYRQNLDGSEPRYYLSNAPADPRPWRIETEFVGLDYETRTWSGWHHHITMCLLAGAFLLTRQQDWGEKYAPDHTAPGVPSSA